jgi:hypothetical protein
MSNYCQPSRPIASEKVMVDSIRSLAVISLFFWMPPPDGEGWEWHDGRHIQLLDGVAVWE